MWPGIIASIIAIPPIVLLFLWFGFTRKQDVIDTHETDARILGTLALVAILCGLLFVCGLLLIGLHLASQRNIWSAILPAPLILPVALLPYSYLSLERFFKRNHGIRRECMTHVGTAEWRVLVNELSQKLGLRTAPVVAVVPRKWGSPLIFGKSLKHTILVLPSGFKEMVDSASGGRAEITEGLTRFALLHELAHIKNRDVIFASWLACFLRVFGYVVPLLILSVLLQSLLLPSGYTYVLGFVFLATPYIILLLLADSLQRYRELLADARAGLAMERPILSELLEAKGAGSASPWESLVVMCAVSGAVGTAGAPERKTNLPQAIVHVSLALQEYIRRITSALGRRTYTPQVQVRKGALKSGQYVNVGSVLPSFSTALWNGIVATLLFVLSLLVGITAEQFITLFNAPPQFAIAADVIARCLAMGALLYLVCAYSLPFRKGTNPAIRMRSYTSGLAYRYCASALAGTLPIAALALPGVISLGLNWYIKGMGFFLVFYVAAFLFSWICSLLCHLGELQASWYRRKETLAMFRLLPIGLFIIAAFLIMALWVGWFVTLAGIAIGMPMGGLLLSVCASQGHPTDRWVRFVLSVRGKLLAEVVREGYTITIYSVYLFVGCLTGTGLAIILLLKLAVGSTVRAIELPQIEMLYVVTPILVASLGLSFYFGVRQTSSISVHILRIGHLLSESIRVLGRKPSDCDRERIWLALSTFESRQGGFSTVFSKPLVCMDTTWAALSCLWACGLEPAYKPKHVKWILQCENREGGFGILPGLNSRLSATFYALDSLSVLGSLEAADAEIHSIWIKKWQTQEGGFHGPYSGWEPLTDTYFAIGSLHLLGQADLIDRKHCAMWALNDWRKGNATHERTYYVAKILDWLGYLSEESAEEIDNKYLRPFAAVMTQLRIEKHPGPVFYYLSCAEVVKGLHYIEQEMGQFADRVAAAFSSFVQRSAEKLFENRKRRRKDSVC